MDVRFIFSSTYSAWNKLSIAYNTECVTVTPESSNWIRQIAPIANAAKKALIMVAFVISTAVTSIFSMFFLPYRLYLWTNIDRIKEDLKLLSPTEAIELGARIRKYIDTKEQAGKFKVPTLEKEDYIQKMMAYYARSEAIYGSVAADWTEHLLEKANESGKKLVFMARDGIVPYKIALQMMQNEEYQEKYPNLVGEDKIQLAYLSRNVVNHANSSEDNRQLFKEYMSQLGVEDGDECIFVDIGFSGSMINDIENMLPEVSIKFHYLISHNNRAEGFIYSENDPRLSNEQNDLSNEKQEEQEEQEKFLQLPTITSIQFKGAGSNLATHWLEDTHQGVGESAKFLVRGPDGRIYPNTKVPQNKLYAAEIGTLDYLLRKWSQKAVVENWETFINDGHSLKEAVAKLDLTLNKIVNGELPLLIKHR